MTDWKYKEFEKNIIILWLCSVLRLQLENIRELLKKKEDFYVLLYYAIWLSPFHLSESGKCRFHHIFQEPVYFWVWLLIDCSIVYDNYILIFIQQNILKNNSDYWYCKINIIYNYKANSSFIRLTQINSMFNVRKKNHI